MLNIHNFNPSNKKLILCTIQRNFFLKYLQKKNIIKNDKFNTPVKTDSINIKELLDEKNVKITISDIWHDYRNFRREYYTHGFGYYSKERDINPDGTSIVEEVKLPFEKKETN